jgi:hypothetical protein
MSLMCAFGCISADSFAGMSIPMSLFAEINSGDTDYAWLQLEFERRIRDGKDHIAACKKRGGAGVE